MKKNTFSRNVRMIRLDHGLTQPALAKLMDVSVRTVANWESEGKKHKHEESLLGQIKKAVGDKKRNTDAQFIFNTESEETDEMWKDKYIQQLELNLKQQLEISALKDQLLKKAPTLKKKSS